jgi:hypothetical protein
MPDWNGTWKTDLIIDADGWLMSAGTANAKAAVSGEGGVYATNFA